MRGFSFAVREVFVRLCIQLFTSPDNKAKVILAKHTP